MLKRWVPFHREGAIARCRLFCFPHAGGNAMGYHSLARLMPADIELCPVELPGRAARLDEPAIRSMGELVDTLSDALRPLLDVPFAFFGHSVGACIAFEAARRLRANDGRTAAHLFVSARAAPGLFRPAAPLSDLSD